MKLRILFSFLFILIVLTVLAGCLKEIGQEPVNDNEPEETQGRYDGLAKCLTEKGVTMYGTEWCSHCKNQKEAFGESFQYINYVDCDVERSKCSEAGVRGYPTWRIGGENYPGEQPLPRLGELAGC